MSTDRIDLIFTSVHEMLSRPSNTSTEQCIFKVHDRLQSHNKEAYKPQVLSIGPYHHDDCNLKKMETYKLRYLQDLLARGGESNVDIYIIALRELKDRARRCYAEEVRFSEDDFVKMLCLDGLFVIEFLTKLHSTEQQRDDRIFQMDWLIRAITGDLILFENQIPFFILDKLFSMARFPGQVDNLIELARPIWKVLPDIHPSGSCPSISEIEVIHLLDLLHKILCSSFVENFNDPGNDSSLKIKSARELQQSGIKFERAKQHGSWLHITFENGKMEIPHLIVHDYTESVFRNLIAFEQYMTDSQSWKFITDYASFLDDLISSPRDVEKLCHCQIITNDLGDDEVVATMFNKLVRDITVSKKFCYSRVYKEVNKYAGKHRNIWKAHLMRNYFNTPWSIISFLAAVVLLILTFAQTIFSILAVGKN